MHRGAQHGPRAPGHGGLRKCVAAPTREPHHGPQRRFIGGRNGWRICPVEMAIGIALVVISAVEIWVIVRAVSANLNLGR